LEERAAVPRRLGPALPVLPWEREMDGGALVRGEGDGCCYTPCSSGEGEGRRRIHETERKRAAVWGRNELGFLISSPYIPWSSYRAEIG